MLGTREIPRYEFVSVLGLLSLLYNKMMMLFLLDSTKAFDTVPHDGLRVKLFDYGSAGKLWLLLDNMYNNLSSSVLCNGILSKWFKHDMMYCYFLKIE
jgi:hypothetical protein